MEIESECSFTLSSDSEPDSEPSYASQCDSCGCEKICPKCSIKIVVQDFIPVEMTQTMPSDLVDLRRCSDGSYYAASQGTI